MRTSKDLRGIYICAYGTGSESDDPQLEIVTHILRGRPCEEYMEVLHFIDAMVDDAVMIEAYDTAAFFRDMGRHYSRRVLISEE